MATVHILKDRQGNTWQLTLSGRSVVTGEGEDRIIQSFPSAAAAQEHLDRVIAIRKREGYALAEVREITQEEAAAAFDPLAGCVAWDAARGRMTITFKGAKVPPGRSAQIVERVAQQAPATLQLICDHASPGKAFGAALAGKALPSLQTFIFDTHFQTLARQRENAFGDLADVLAAAPALTRAFVSGDLALRAARHEALRELYLLGDPLAPAAVEALGRCAFPALEILAIDLCSDAGPGPDRVAAAALRALAAPNLRAVHLCGVDDVTSVLDALTATPLPPSWSTLCVDGTIDDEDALLALLERRAPALAALETLALPLSDNLSQEGEDAAKRLLASAVDRDELPDLLLPDTYMAW